MGEINCDIKICMKLESLGWYVIETMLQAHIQLFRATKRTDQHVSGIPIDLGESIFNTNRKRGTFKCRFRRISNQLIQHIRYKIDCGRQERNTTDVHLTDDRKERQHVCEEIQEQENHQTKQ